MEMERERPAGQQQRERERQHELQLLRKKNAELALQTKKLEEKVRSLEKVVQVFDMFFSTCPSSHHFQPPGETKEPFSRV